MSTDLQQPQPNGKQLAGIRLSSLKLDLPPPPSADESHAIQQEDCLTPTSPEHRIPEILTCPPPPRKQRPSGPSCKRRLSEFQFFEAVARDEIDSFFKSSYELVSRNSKKRRCLL